ncbi:IscS subfamily cysteine desulfurase [Bacillus weihaiensis]|uniref:IscS subfamily cysteine desulfurase n=1 Tax=Bacillus weihaiensis TaxID=1547283 RepID=UPI00235477BF|nr:IscS subfamily cysteine desulfurase [Bacillus weihaiensis]
MIYLDYAATTPMSDNALDMYVKAAKKAYGNSSSLHDIGEMSARTLEASRKIIGDCIHASEKGIYFTGGGSEANVLIIQSLLKSLPSTKNHIITTEIEHSSLHTFFQKLQNEGYKITFLKTDSKGRISIEEVRQSISDRTGIISIQHANSEIGTIQPIQEIGKIAKEKNIFFHSDCVQTFGKIPLHVEELNVDALSISSHKIYGPKGIGAAYINPSIHWQPVIPGTTHESGFRPGTVDVPSIAAFATAAKDIVRKLEANLDHYHNLRREFIDSLTLYNERITLINEEAPSSLPTIFPLVVHGIEGQYMMLECNRFGYAISTGSACQIGMQAPSRSLTAIGFHVHEAKQYIRISTGIHTTTQDLQSLLKTMQKIIHQFR